MARSGRAKIKNQRLRGSSDSYPSVRSSGVRFNLNCSPASGRNQRASSSDRPNRGAVATFLKESGSPSSSQKCVVWKMLSVTALAYFMTRTPDGTGVPTSATKAASGFDFRYCSMPSQYATTPSATTEAARIGKFHFVFKWHPPSND
jgi:hypothetical protein